MKESTDRPAWTPTIKQGRGNGLYAFRHKVIKRVNCSAEVVKNFDWTADANAVVVELKGN